MDKPSFGIRAIRVKLPGYPVSGRQYLQYYPDGRWFCFCWGESKLSNDEWLRVNFKDKYWFYRVRVERDGFGSIKIKNGG